MPFAQAIDRLLERVDTMIAGQRRFIADAAHELRTPLTALSLQVQNIAQAETREQMQERLIPLQAGIERARQMTLQLLNLARLQAGSDRLVTIDVSTLTRELIAEYIPVAEAKHIDLGMEEKANLNLQGEPDSLRLILRNALENALKYTPQNGEVTVKLTQENGNAAIEVIDNGSGIPVEKREEVFEPFFRLHTATGEGSGLGLAIAREAASRLGGQVSLLENPNGQGLVFRYQQRTS